MTCCASVVYDAFEHWKELVKLLCFSEKALVTHSELFTNFICKGHHILFVEYMHA